ncbi:GNAT family N-acetyltransferase [Olivibacter sp. SDN3]|uniref:GNAT family N-acetyltransferase n=1 Tax=Olivibacter sp. SDN3 TaxID=2764720 RepID=UPI001650DDEA|nr:GNAT family N-acetyltransferase [Olivibacter sp. SDN3]QNL50508.1 GNAT family N-acetyltransferase [Olivibacter sp. SDN3]
MYQIETLNNQDIDQIINLILPIQQIEHHIAVDIQDQPDLLAIEHYYHHAGGCFWGIKHNCEIIATIALIKLPSDQGGVIRKMFVKKEYRGKELGLAQMLLAHLINYAQEIKLKTLYLGTVHTLRAAIRFYERNHFVQINKNNLPSNFPIMEVDDVFYSLQLNTENE